MFQSEQYKVLQKLKKEGLIQAQYALNVAVITFIITTYNYQVSLMFFSCLDVSLNFTANC